jgi:N-succinyldiaminopimelate aminotransferase
MALPADAAAAALWLDEDHVGPTRDFYRGLFDLAEKHLGGHPGFRRPAGGFFLWLEVGDSEATAVALWRHAAIRSLPGAYLGRVGPAGNPGLNYLRLALVHPSEITDEALGRIAAVL